MPSVLLETELLPSEVDLVPPEAGLLPPEVEAHWLIITEDIILGKGET